MKEKVLFLLGMTGSGKSDVAVELAKVFHGEIISASPFFPTNATFSPR